MIIYITAIWLVVKRWLTYLAILVAALVSAQQAQATGDTLITSSPSITATSASIPYIERVGLYDEYNFVLAANATISWAPPTISGTQLFRLNLCENNVGGFTPTFTAVAGTIVNRIAGATLTTTANACSTQYWSYRQATGQFVLESVSYNTNSISGGLPANSCPANQFDISNTTAGVFSCALASLIGLSDTNIVTPTDAQLLQYRTSDNKWHNFTLSGAGAVDNTGAFTFNITGSPCAAHHFAISLSSTGTWACAQPDITDITGVTLTAHTVLLGEGTTIGTTSTSTAGQMLIGQGVTLDPAFETISGDCTITNTGAITCTKINGVTPGGSCSTGDVVTSISSSGVPTCSHSPYDIVCAFNGLPPTTGTGSYCYVAMSGAFTLPANCAAVTSHQSEGTAVTASTGTAVFTMKKLHSGVLTTIGTWTFTTSAIGACATTGGAAQTFVAGDQWQLIAPGSQDATLADVSMVTTLQRQ